MLDYSLVVSGGVMRLFSYRPPVLAYLLSVLLLSLALLVAGCPQTRGDAIDAGVEAGPDLTPDSDRCDPGCHYDCFGGVGCITGGIWIYGRGAIPCCHFGDPIPGEDSPAGPCAETDKPAYVCASRGCARPADPRYRRCAYKRPMVLPGSEVYYRVHCAGSSRRAGDRCSADTDCRPSATDARLRCELPAGRCVETPRPTAPAGYGESCGLASGGNDEVVWAFPNARRDLRLCHVATDFAPGCLRQGMTMHCLLDEDCPAGSICLCDTYPVPICARATDRTTPAGRSAGLRCF
jgi:hypothetical protein